MAKNHRERTTDSRSISFPSDLLKKIDAECVRLDNMDRSRFIQMLAEDYFDRLESSPSSTLAARIAKMIEAEVKRR